MSDEQGSRAVAANAVDLSAPRAHAFVVPPPYAQSELPQDINSVRIVLLFWQYLKNELVPDDGGPTVLLLLLSGFNGCVSFKDEKHK